MYEACARLPGTHDCGGPTGSSYNIYANQHYCDVQGVWKPAKIANPNYFEDKEPLRNLGNIGAVAVEIWTMDQGYYFDNVLVANEASKAEEYRTKYWQPKHEVELVRHGLLHGLALLGAGNFSSG